MSSELKQYIAIPIYLLFSCRFLAQKMFHKHFYEDSQGISMIILTFLPARNAEENESVEHSRVESFYNKPGKYILILSCSSQLVLNLLDQVDDRLASLRDRSCPRRMENQQRMEDLEGQDGKFSQTQAQLIHRQSLFKDIHAQVRLPQKYIPFSPNNRKNAIFSPKSHASLFVSISIKYFSIQVFLSLLNSPVYFHSLGI